MSSPSWAWAIASRNEPGPLSRVFRTVSVLGSVRSSRISSRGVKERLLRKGFRPILGWCPGLRFMGKEVNHMRVSCLVVGLQFYERASSRRADRAPAGGTRDTMSWARRPVRGLLRASAAPADLSVLKLTPFSKRVRERTAAKVSEQVIEH